MADLGAIDEDVPFDDEAADALIRACDGAAETIEGQAESRRSWTNTALADFRGRYSRLFRNNAAVAAGDAAELCNRLREVAKGARRLKSEAHKEQQRRETAREWKDRNLLEQGWDWLMDNDPPGGPPADEPTIEVSPSVNRTRETPSPARDSGGDSGTSAARPKDLRTFARQSRGANTELRSKPGQLRAKLADFRDKCRWGRLDASGVVTGFDKWLKANDEDVRWATTIADAFAAAGGEGAVSTLANSALAAALRAAGVDATRDDLVIDPPEAFGHPPTTGYADDPVNTSTGNFVESETDLAFPGAAAALVLNRCYNSFNTGVGAFGPGWSSVAESGLAFDADGERARLTLPDGRQIVFPRLGDGWGRAQGDSLWLGPEPAADDSYRVTGNDGRWWRCDGRGRLLAYGIGPEDTGNVIRLVRDDAGRLARLEHGRGRSIELTWGPVGDGDGDLVLAATSSDGRRVDYAYDEAGRLAAATGPLGTRTYRWTESDDVAGQGLLEAVIDADGVVEAENGYDEMRRVIRQRSSFGRVTRYAYLPGRVTVVSDEDGNRSNTWIADERGRLVGVLDADGNRQSTSYDADGNPVLVTERDGSTTVREYDNRGRLVRTVTPSAADLTWGYDDDDRVRSVVAEQGAVTEFGYTGDQRDPSVITDPEGGITRLTWERGLLTETTDPTGVTIRFDYDEHGDLVAMTDAEGNTARMERDALGRVTAAITPSGHRTDFDYDPASGLLASRRDPDGATWRYECTTAGRLAAIVDPTGARSIIEHGPHGEESRTIDPLGRVLGRELDDLGNLAAVELPDGATWRFAHDPMSRLVATTDPTGATSRREYDANGVPTASVDPTGVRRGVGLDETQRQLRIDDGEASSDAQFDPLGRLTALGQPDGSTAVFTYDRCGRPVESLDPEGGLTLIRRDAAGRAVEITTPTGAVTRYEYDRCGRLGTVIDPVGGRTTIAYDSDGLPTRQTLPTGEQAWTRYDVCGRVVAHHQPGIGTVRYTYDAGGRVVQTRDAQSGRRTFRYDAAGQLVAAVDGNGGTTRYGYDANGRAVEITTPVGGVIRREFDAMNRCVAETDPLGRTTRAGYDAAGRLVWQIDPDGHRTTWTYDSAGRPLSMAVDGRTLTTLGRDLRNRTVVIEDTTGDRPVRHELEWNRLGQLIRRSRDGRQVSWTYDADGRRSSMTTPDGQTTRYGCDAAGRLTSVEHPELGRAAFDRDAAGRLVAATAGGLMQSWGHRDGFVVAHTITDADGATRTSIERDDEGRIQQISRDTDGPITTSYGYDDANQLIEARTAGPDVASQTTWRYDAGGRLIQETIDDVAVEHTYDVAGELLATVGGEGGRQTHDYDGLGRRVRTTDESGTRREFSWSMTGHLAAVTDHSGDRVQRTTLHTDGLGELAAADGVEVFWDTAAFAGAPALVGDASVVTAGAVTAISGQWTAPGWRTSRSMSADPWNPPPVTDAASLAAGIQLGGSGEVQIAGLEWMGARVYDPASRGFLSVDPLEVVTGSGWSANPYAYGGNDPLHALDPRGLKPVTDAELQAYRDSHGIGAAVQAVGDWASENWEYIAGGAMVIAGGALIATGAGGPLGMMMVSAGADTIIQKATTGDVDWGMVGVSFAAGGIGGGFAAAKFGVTGLKATVASGAASGATGGAMGNTYTYATGPGPHTVGGLLGATATGAASGAVLGAAGGAAGQGAAALGGKVLGRVRPTPDPPASPGTELVPVGGGEDFRSTAAAFRHYSKHVKGVVQGSNGRLSVKPGGPDMPEYSGFSEYRSAARQFMGGHAEPGVLERGRGTDTLRVDPSSGRFGVRADDGTIRTFFRPSGDPVQYYNGQ